MATIRKVADLAGVSTATVSHVINDTGAVSALLTARAPGAITMLMDRIKAGASPARGQTFAAKLVTRASTIGTISGPADV